MKSDKLSRKVLFFRIVPLYAGDGRRVHIVSASSTQHPADKAQILGILLGRMVLILTCILFQSLALHSIFHWM